LITSFDRPRDFGFSMLENYTSLGFKVVSCTSKKSSKKSHRNKSKRIKPPYIMNPSISPYYVLKHGYPRFYFISPHGPNSSLRSSKKNLEVGDLFPTVEIKSLQNKKYIIVSGLRLLFLLHKIF